MKKSLIIVLSLCFLYTITMAQDTEPNFEGSGVQGDQPMFPGCEDVDDMQERKKCADSKMLQFLYGSIKYPAEARANNIEGMVVIKFFIEEDGSIRKAKVVRDIGGGCGEEALRVVESMPNWHPAIIDGNPTGASYHLPIKFSLGKNKKR